MVLAETAPDRKRTRPSVPAPEKPHQGVLGNSKLNALGSLIYVNRYYEINLTTGTETTHYYLGGRQVAFRKGDTLEYPLDDHLFSTVGAMDDHGNKISTVKYFPFGSTRFQEGEPGFDKMFTGQRLDQTGLYFYNARYYDAEIGRFISPDTIVPDWTNPQTLNRYSYCYNNPLAYMDPTGHWGWSNVKKWCGDRAKNVENVAKAAASTVVDAGKAVVNSTAGKIAIGVVGAVVVTAAIVVAAPVVLPALAAAATSVAGAASAVGITSGVVTGALTGAAAGAIGQVGGTMLANSAQGNSLFQGLSWTGVAQSAIIGGLTGGAGGAIATTNALTNIGKGIMVAEADGFGNYITDVVQGQTALNARTATVIGVTGLASARLSDTGEQFANGMMMAAGHTGTSKIVANTALGMNISLVSVGSGAISQLGTNPSGTATGNGGYSAQGASDYMNFSASTYGCLF